MMKKFLFILLTIFSSYACADELAGIGKVALNILDPVGIVSDFVGSASIIIGTCCLFGAFLKYMQHRVNPHVAPMSTIVLLAICGIVLLLLPFTYLITPGGIPYNLFK